MIQRVDFAVFLTVLLFFASVLPSACAVDKPLASFLSDHCTSCHDDDTQKGGVNLARLEAEWDDPDAVRIWSRVHDRVVRREMPPKSETQPQRAVIDAFSTHLADLLLQADRAKARSSLRRLNRIEYENTVCDLFGIRAALKGYFPEDPSAFGFDTVGDVLTISPEHMEVYLLAADRAIHQILGPEQRPPQINFTKLLSKDSFASRAIDRTLMKTTEGGLVAFQDHNCPLIIGDGHAKATGTYRIRIQAKPFQTDDALMMAVYAGDVIRKTGIRLVDYFDIPGEDQWTTIEFEDYLEVGHTYRMAPYGLVAPTQGPNRFKGPGLMIGEVSVRGPLEEWPPTSRTSLLGEVTSPSPGIEDARKIFQRLMPRAFRRTIDPGEIEAPLKLTNAALESGRSFEDAVGVGIKMILCSPGFLLREERPLEVEGRDVVYVDDEALASRLSYFLWSSMPDDELLSLGAAGTLHQPVVLRQQVERMLKDPKADRFVQNFTGQWLNLRDILFTEPDATLFPEFDEMLRYSMVEETHYYFHEILESDLSLVEFVDSDWTILNERLAAHYGLKGIRGAKFQHVRLPPASGRGGVLTQASVLKVTANGTATSPVVRGVWVLNNILGQPTPPPPPNIPVIEPDIRGASTIREQVKKHRSIESCAGCHDRIDPPGLALEGFDPIGGLRKSYRSIGAGEPVNLRIKNKRVQYRIGQPVDSSGVMPDGRRFKNVIDFKKILTDDKASLATCLTEKLLIYGLGRNIRFSDRGSIQEIVAKVAEKNYGFRSLIHEVIQSETFRKR